VALAELVENNIHLTSLGLEWNSIGMVESGMQRLCHVRRHARMPGEGGARCYDPKLCSCSPDCDVTTGAHAELDSD
jgi:hypothetical protein